MRIGDLIRALARLAVRFYYPRIEIESREHLPAKGATLFVANHPNSVMDAPLIGWVVQRPIHFFAKASLFELPVFGTLLHLLGMMPAYRGVDDISQVKRNLQSLEGGAIYLLQDEAVGIFPEGKSHDREGLERVRTGAARMAWEAVRGGAAVAIVPIGLNYERKERFRSAVCVGVGEPIDAGTWFDARKEEEKKAVRTLTAEIDRRLKSLIVSLDEPAWEPLLIELEILLPAEGKDAASVSGKINYRKRLADAMNYFLSKDRVGSENLAAAIRDHEEAAHRARLSLESPILRQGAGRLSLQLIERTLWLTLGFVPAIAGTIHHIAPFLITRGLARLFPRQGRTTIAHTRLLIGLPVYLLSYAAIWWVLSRRLSLSLAIIWIAIAPFAGLAAIHYWWRLELVGRDWWQELKMLFRPRQLRRLRTERFRIRRELLRLREEYRANQ